MVGTTLDRIVWATNRRAAGAARVWGAVLALGVALSAGAAHALPVFFTGLGNIGTTQAEALAAIASFPGLQLLDLDLPIPGLGSVIFSGAGAATVPTDDCSADLLVDPDPFCIALRLTIPPQTLPGSEASPAPVITTKAWTVTNSTGQDLAAAYLLFTTSESGANSGDPALVGLDPNPADGYVMVEMSGLYAAAISLGPLVAGASTTALVNYFVNDDLKPTGTGNFLLPKLNPEAILVMVPEPGTLVLLAAGMISTVRIRRSRCE